MSMPSLAMECVVGEASPPAARPVLEKSRSSASMVQGREGREGATLPFLDQLEERAGHSEESLTDPQVCELHGATMSWCCSCQFLVSFRFVVLANWLATFWYSFCYLCYFLVTLVCA